MKATIIGLVIVILVILGAWWVVAGRDDEDVSQDVTTAQQSEEETATDLAPSTTENVPATTEIEIEDLAFGSQTITIKAGTTVKWTNKDGVEHTVTKDSGETGPDSEQLARDQSYSFTFETPGTYTYHCEIHPDITGTVIVTE